MATSTTTEKKSAKEVSDIVTDAKPVSNTSVNAKPASATKQKESVYKIEELAANAETLFGATPECVFAALKEKDITECTKSKAEEIVKKFRERKVE